MQDYAPAGDAAAAAGGADVVTHCLRAIDAKLAAGELDDLALDADRTFACLSSFLHRLPAVGEIFWPPLAADAAVHATHCALCEQLLARRSFSSTLALAREAQARLARALAWRAACGEGGAERDAKLAPVLEWLEARSVVPELLAVNMHQWQYVESLRALLTTLAEAGALSEATLRSLWAQLRQVCTCRHPSAHVPCAEHVPHYSMPLTWLLGLTPWQREAGARTGALVSGVWP